ncbi:hypothetical protein AOLI_G00121880 [Acnodon oligacanthus]
MSALAPSLHKTSSRNDIITAVSSSLIHRQTGKTPDCMRGNMTKKLIKHYDEALPHTKTAKKRGNQDLSYDCWKTAPCECVLCFLKSTTQHKVLTS